MKTTARKYLAALLCMLLAWAAPDSLAQESPEATPCTNHSYHYNGDSTHSCTTPGCTLQGEACNFSTASCMEPSQCKKCGHQRSGPLGHKSVPNGNGTHTCTICNIGMKCSIRGEDNCTEAAKCYYCDWAPGAPLGHDWQPDGAGQHRCARCGEAGDCDMTLASCTRPETCPLCQQTRGITLPHSWKAVEGRDVHACTVCGTEQTCSGGAASCTLPAVCSGCGGAYGALEPHSWSAVVEKDRHICTVCGTQEACSGGTASCSRRAVCTACGAEYSGFRSHKWRAKPNGTHSCTNCGASRSCSFEDSGSGAVCTGCGGRQADAPVLPSPSPEAGRSPDPGIAQILAACREKLTALAALLRRLIQCAL